MLLYEANNTEEPYAGKPHAGTCERGRSGNWPSYRNTL